MSRDSVTELTYLFVSSTTLMECCMCMRKWQFICIQGDSGSTIYTALLYTCIIVLVSAVAPGLESPSCFTCPRDTRYVGVGLPTV